MTKKDILVAYSGAALGLKRNPTRDEFIRISKISKRQIDREFGSFSAMKSAHKKFDLLTAVQDDTQQARNEPETRSESSTITLEGDNVRSIEELASYSKIDLNKWEATKFAVSLWDKKTSVKAEFKLKAEERAIDQLLENFISEANQHAPKTFAPVKVNNDGRLLIINLPDSHINKFGVMSETGHDDYNLEAAIANFEKTVENLLNRAKSYTKIEKVLFVLGNDFINADNIAGTTTAFTPQDNDKSWFEAFSRGAKLMTDTIEKIATVAPVDVVVCLGNHDTHTSFAIGEYVKAWFRNHPYVKVENSPKFRKYYRYFSNAFCLSHGNNEKLTDLPLIMATECGFWSECKNREIFSHHTHHQSLFENRGVITRVFPSLSGCDLFHSKKGYVGARQVGQVLIYNKTGFEALFEYSPSQGG